MNVGNQESIRIQIGVNRDLRSSVWVSPKIPEFGPARPNHPEIKPVLLPELTAVNGCLSGKILSKKVCQRPEIKKAL
jgi:hypothetical protein